MGKTTKIILVIVVFLLLGGAVYYFFVVKGKPANNPDLNADGTPKTTESRASFVARRTIDYSTSADAIAAGKAAHALSANPTRDQLLAWGAQQANFEADKKGL